LNVVIAFPSAFTDERILARTIEKAARKTIRSVAIEHNCVICESSDIVELACQLATMFGVESVAVAKKVSSNFSALSAAIVEVGVSLIIPGDRFHVKVILQPTAKCDYVSRDIEFAASGMLTARVASITALPAKTEEDASRQILAVVGRESAYVCIQTITAPSGLIASSHGEVLSSIHDSLSFLSSMMAAKAGFDCSSILLPYVDKSELEINAKLVQSFAARTGRKKQTILTMPINVPGKGAASALLKEKIISKVLIRNQNSSRIIFPFTTAYHPVWFIETIFQETLAAGKMPFAPLIFLSNELVMYAQQAGIELNISSSAADITKGKIQRYGEVVDFEAKSAIKHTKRLELKIGPNYLHDILDTI
jgi:hypothetical protein